MNSQLLVGGVVDTQVGDLGDLFVFILESELGSRLSCDW
jgi:hypothetical protein